MKKINIKVIAIVLAVIMLVAFSYGGFKRTNNMYKKYKLASIAIGKGATYVTVESDSVSYLLGNSYMTYSYYSFDYAIKELSGK